jgi:hypothetical protein
MDQHSNKSSATSLVNFVNPGLIYNSIYIAQLHKSWSMKLDRLCRVSPVLLSLINLTFYLLFVHIPISYGFLYSALTTSRTSSLNHISSTKLQSSPQYVQGSTSSV